MNRETIPSPRARLFCAAFVFVSALSLYYWTLAPTVTLVDSGELILVAHGLGVAHPPGFPLWVMLAHLASLLPCGNVAVRVNFSSALFGALACGMLALVVMELMITVSCLIPAKRTKKSGQQTKSAQESKTGLLVIAPALGAGLLLAFSRTLWSYATITEVYALNTFLILIIFFLMLRWRRRIVADRQRNAVSVKAARITSANTAHDAFLYIAAFVFGLALGDHHVTVGLTLPAIAVMVFRTENLRFFLGRRLIYAGLISIAGLVAVYSYLPLAASHSPLINWGEPRSLQAIWWHITGRQYQIFLTFTPALMGEQFVQFAKLLFREFGQWWLPLPLALAATGVVRAFKTDRTTFWFLLSLLTANLAYNLSYEIAEDKDAYYLPAFVAVAIAAGFGVRWLIEHIVLKSGSANRYVVTTVVVLIAPAIALTGNWFFDNRRHYFIAHDYVENIFRSIKPNGLLLTEDWQVASPMFYVQEIEQRRRDVKVIDINLLRRLWYFDYLQHAQPGLMDRSREKIEPYLELLRQWERDPAAFKGSALLTQKISTAFLELIQSMVRTELKVAPVYMTNDVLAADRTNGYLTQWIPQAYRLVPQGLVFNLATDSGFDGSPDVRLETRGLADGTVRFEKDDVVNVKVLSAYTSMLINRGRYLAMFGQHGRAIIVFKQALALSPGLAAAQQGFAESIAKLGNQ
jgi:hypothetical protein